MASALRWAFLLPFYDICNIGDYIYISAVWSNL